MVLVFGLGNLNIRRLDFLEINSYCVPRSVSVCYSLCLAGGKQGHLCPSALEYTAKMCVERVNSEIFLVNDLDSRLVTAIDGLE